MASECLTILPVYNEFQTVNQVLDEVKRHCCDVLVVDDGSSDGTSELLANREGIKLLSHEVNQGYGAALISGFKYAIDHGYDVAVTIDCDGQHEPQRIQAFAQECRETGCDIISGSRYLMTFDADSTPPEDRRQVNRNITEIINDRLDLELTDAFCGFKAYQVSALAKLELSETGYAMPLELWVQAACHGLTIQEIAVPLIYLDANRSFGEQLDDPQIRLDYYIEVLDRCFAALPDDCEKLKSRVAG